MGLIIFLDVHLDVLCVLGVQVLIRLILMLMFFFFK